MILWWNGGAARNWLAKRAQDAGEEAKKMGAKTKRQSRRGRADENMNASDVRDDATADAALQAGSQASAF